MYADFASSDSSLRQGDILAFVPFPILDTDIAVLGRIDPDTERQTPIPKLIALEREHRNRRDCFAAQTKMRLCFGAVLAHCCELELRNGRCLLASVPIARLVPVKMSISGDETKIASLRANKDPRNQDDPGYIDYFYVAPHERLHGAEWVVEYCQITSIPGTEYNSLLNRKILQLSDRDRVKFKIKLAAFLGSRLTDEEIAAGLENPWDVR